MADVGSRPQARARPRSNRRDAIKPERRERVAGSDRAPTRRLPRTRGDPRVPDVRQHPEVRGPQRSK